MEVQTLLAVDPHPSKLAVVRLDLTDEPLGVLFCDIVPFGDIMDGALDEEMKKSDWLAVERVASYGMPVGKSTFDTCLSIGCFIHKWGGDKFTLITRNNIKLAVCHNSRAKKSNINQALIERYGGPEKAVGVKCKKCKGKGWFGRGRPPCPKCDGGGWKFSPGPLRGIKYDLWDALAVGHTFNDYLTEGRIDLEPTFWWSGL